ncbi:hypothetical protein KDN34_07320 [Shewanella yunxiaonensis]|uniref:Nickel transport protein n=1 Tax=Shewanella yunxiaonensis TaxID=2829809 RepID=A0ABX7YYU0_9GAMM|nr:hypothetical protein [Shewanella yunxiaonensis]QUN07226.1 hypothetical protein KDN34_07320 [Shewanella yunxiaonensis]
MPLANKSIVIGLLLMLSGVCSLPASAHLLKVFAWAEGHEIVGNAYFAGGIAAGGAHIKVFDQQHQLVAEVSPDHKGDFRVKVPGAADYSIVADTEDGHVAHWEIKAAEVAAPAVASATVAEPKVADNAVTNSPAVSATAAIDKAQLEQLVQTAVAQEIGPLRMELQQYADRLRLSDLLGGIGFIFGLTGSSLWWRSRKLQQ